MMNGKSGQLPTQLWVPSYAPGMQIIDWACQNHLLYFKASDYVGFECDLLRYRISANSFRP